MENAHKFKAFVVLVSSMRAAQKEYFKTRAQSALQKSKDLERSVDAMVSDIKGGQMGLGI